MLLFCFTSAFADADFATIFQNTNGCFILYDLKQNKIIQEYNPQRCAERISPESTFKIALSLMAFDQNLITQKTIFKWDGVDKGMSAWNQDQTPHTWLSNSAVWVSRLITQQLGIAKIQMYLDKFNYGNKDFSGDPGKNNGLTNAWLSSSLKISADEQLHFLQRLYLTTLPVLPAAMNITKQNMHLEMAHPNGWDFYGKTGTGYKTEQVATGQNPPQVGWFVGFLEQDGVAYAFVLNFSDLQNPVTSEAGGVRAKAMVETILRQDRIIPST